MSAIPYGLALGAGQFNHAYINAVRDTGANVIRSGVAWDTIDPNLDGTCTGGNFTYVDGLVSYCNSLVLSDGVTVGMKVILQMQTGPTNSGIMLAGGVMTGSTVTTQPPAMLNYGKAAIVFGQRYDGTAGKNVYRMEFGNEPNGLVFNSSSQTGIPGAWYGPFFAQMMIQIYGGDGINTGLHDLNPSLKIMTGGLGGGTGESDGIDSPTFVSNAYSSITFGGHTYTTGWKDHFDVLGHHSYCYPITPSQDTSRGWYRMLLVRAAMVAAGDTGKKISVTEWGAPTNLDTDPTGLVQNDAQHIVIAAQMQDAYTLFTSYSWADSFCFFEFMNNNKTGKVSGNPVGNANMQGIVYNNAVPASAVKKSHTYVQFQTNATGSPTLPPPSVVRAADIPYGVGFTPNYSDATARTNQFDKAFNKTTGLGLGFVRIDVQWDDIQPTNPGSLGPGLNDTFVWTNVDKVIANCDALGLKWLVMFGYGANWTNGGAGNDKVGPTRGTNNLYPDYARAAHAVVDHIQSNTSQLDVNGNGDLVYALEIWNEPNIAQFFNTSGNADPQKYWTMERGAFNAVKTGQVGNYASFIRNNLTPSYPNVRVITGGATTPQGGVDRAPRDWVKDAFTYGAGSSFDNFSLHIYDWEFGPLSTAFGGGDPLTGWNPFLETKQVRDYLVSQGVMTQVWCTESGSACRPDSTGTDPASHSGNGGFDGTGGHTPGAGQSTTDALEISYTLAASRYTDHDAAWRAYQDTNGVVGWTGPTSWFTIDSTIPTYHVADGSGYNGNYGFWEYDTEHAGAEKQPAAWPGTKSAREIVNALANGVDIVAPTVTLKAPAAGDPTLKGNVAFYAQVHDAVTADANLVVKLHHDNKDTHGTDTIIGLMTYSPSLGFANFALTFDTTTLSDGTYQFWVTAVDQAGNAATITYLTIAVLNVGDAFPSCVISLIKGSPPNSGQGLTNQTVAIVATATDDVSIANVHLFVDGIDAGASSGGTPPSYNFSYNTASLGAGTHVFEAHATDSIGQVRISTPCMFAVNGTGGADVTAPVVTVSTINGALPVADQTLTGTVPFSITSIDAVDANPTTHLLFDGTIHTRSQPTRVGNVWTWQVDTSIFDFTIEHNVTGRSTDASGNVGKSLKALFFVTNPQSNTPPVVTPVAVALPSIYAAAVLADNPRGYWRLHSTTGVYGDSSGFARDATIGGSGSTRGVAGLIVSDPNKAFQVAGAAYADAADNDVWSIDQTGKLTVEFLMKPSSFPGTGDPVTHSNGSIEWAVRTTAAGLIQLRAWTSGTTAILGLMSATTFVAGTTYHIACVYNNAGLCKIYVNGVLDASDTMTGSTSNSASPLRIGARGDGAEFFRGVIDEVAIYDTELSASRIAVHAAAVTVVANLYDTTPDGMTVSGVVSVTGTATDVYDTAVTVQLLIDGVPGQLCVADGVLSEYVGLFDTTTVSNGTHSIQIVAVDRYQTVGTSSIFHVVVHNAVALGIASPLNGAEVSGFVTLSLEASLGASVSVWEGPVGQTPTQNLGAAVALQDGTFQFVLDTNRLSNGAHALVAVEA